MSNLGESGMIRSLSLFIAPITALSNPITESRHHRVKRGGIRRSLEPTAPKIRAGGHSGSINWGIRSEDHFAHDTFRACKVVLVTSICGSPPRQKNLVHSLAPICGKQLRNLGPY